MSRRTRIQALADIVSEVLVPKGFERKGRDWYRDGEGLTAVYYIDKSPFAQRFSSNVGFWLHALSLTDLAGMYEGGVTPSDPRRPHGFQCPLSCFSTPSFDEATRLDIHRALDLEPGDEFDGSRRRVIAEHLQEVVVPLLDKANSVSGLAALLAEGRLNNGLVHHLARAYLESP